MPIKGRGTVLGVFLFILFFGTPIIEFLSDGENDELHRIKSEYEKKLKTNDFDLPYGFDTDIFK